MDGQVIFFFSSSSVGYCWLLMIPLVTVYSNIIILLNIILVAEFAEPFSWVHKSLGEYKSIVICRATEETNHWCVRVCVCTRGKKWWNNSSKMRSSRRYRVDDLNADLCFVYVCISKEYNSRVHYFEIKLPLGRFINAHNNRCAWKKKRVCGANE